MTVENEVQQTNDETGTDERRYPVRTRNPPQYLNDYITNDSTNYIIHHCYNVKEVPLTYEEAVNGPDSLQWKAAMDEEVEALQQNNTYSLCSLPEGKTPISGKWVYAIKTNSDNCEKFKARYVARGFTQIKGIDYQDTFSPTARLTSIRILIQLCIQFDLIVEQLDVKTAYLHADIDFEIYLEQPQGYVKTDLNGNKLYCKLEKSIYGLKQSGRNWNLMLHKFLININFTQSLNDYCFYFKVNGNLRIYIIIFVDDIMIAASNVNLLNDIKNLLMNKFKMKDLGILNMFLGMKFTFDDDFITIDQSKYIDKILTKFKMQDCNPRSIPCDNSIIKLVNDDSNILSDVRLYQEIVGSLIYLMTCTRPDLSYVVTKLSQNMKSPTKAHLNLAKDVLRYVKGTIDYNLKFTKSTCLTLIGYSDSDWGNSGDRKSISGYCFLLNVNGPLISWKSKKQSVVAISSCEAEYIAMTHAIQEAKFLFQFISEIKCCKDKSVIVHVDNLGSIALAQNPVNHQRSKHIDIKYHFIRNEISEGIVKLHYIPSNNNLADIFTKPFSKIKLNSFSCIRG